jgi:hypothetical protein
MLQEVCWAIAVHEKKNANIMVDRYPIQYVYLVGLSEIYIGSDAEV